MKKEPWEKNWNCRYASFQYFSICFDKMSASLNASHKISTIVTYVGCIEIYIYFMRLTSIVNFIPGLTLECRNLADFRVLISVLSIMFDLQHFEN